MSNKGVFRTAPATPSLLIKVLFFWIQCVLCSQEMDLVIILVSQTLCVNQRNHYRNSDTMTVDNCTTDFGCLLISLLAYCIPEIFMASWRFNALVQYCRTRIQNNTEAKVWGKWLQDRCSHETMNVFFFLRQLK